jgi:hypothetical protein
MALQANTHAKYPLNGTVWDCASPTDGTPRLPPQPSMRRLRDENLTTVEFFE